MVDDQSGFTVQLLHNVPTVLTLAGDHEPTAAGDWAVLVPAPSSSCVGAAFYAAQSHGGALAADLSVGVTLSAEVGEHTLCLAHGPFGGASPVDSEYTFHAHVQAHVQAQA